MNEIEIERRAFDDAELNRLIAKLDLELAERDGDDHEYYHQFNSLTDDTSAVVAFRDGEPVGCGAIRPFEGDLVEIKRMYVTPQARSLGIGGQILAALEELAEEEGYTGCLLETGKKQPEAIRLYEREGYQRIPNFGQYADDQNSVCMKKSIIRKVNLKKELVTVTEHWRPKVVAQLNGQEVKVAKFQGEFPWHHHENEDEMFLGLKGSFLLEFRDKTIEVNEGEFVVVPRGVEHRPVAKEEVEILLFEPANTKNTGNIDDEVFTA